MKKRLWATVAVFMSVCMLAGCGKKSEGETPVVDPKEPSVQVENTDSTPEEITIEDVKVDNASGFFVPVGDKIIYRHYLDPELTRTSALFAEYLTYRINAKGSYICAYDTATGTVGKLFDDEGYGEIYLIGNRLYMTKNNEEDRSILYSTDLNGSDYKELGIGTLVDCDVENGIFVLCDSDYIYNDSTERYEAKSTVTVTHELELVCKKELGFDESISTGKICGDSLVYQTYKAPVDEDLGYGEDVLYSINFKDEGAVFLGVLPKEEEGGFFETSYIEQWKTFGDKVYGMSVVEAGTGHFFQSGNVVSVTPGVENSLKVEATVPAGTEETPKYVINEDGSVDIKKTLAGSIWEDYQCICLAQVDNDSTNVLSYKDLPKPSEYNTDEFYTNVEICQRIGDKVYIVYNESVFSESASIGWREGYDHFYSGYVVADIDGAALKNIKEFDSQVFLSADDMWKTGSANSIYTQVSSYDYYESDGVGEGENYKYFYVYAGNINVYNEGYDALNESLDKFNKELKSEAENTYKANHDECIGHLEADSTARESYGVQMKIRPNRADSKILSFLVEKNYDVISAHPYTYMESRNYISKTGKLITLDDVVTDKAVFADEVIETLVAENPDSLIATETSWKDEVKNAVNSGTITFTILGNGIRVHFDAGVISDMVSGAYDVVIDAADADYMCKDYFYSEDDFTSGIAQALDMDREYNIDVNGDGELDTISWRVENFSDYNYLEYDDVIVSINGVENKVSTWGWGEDIYLVDSGYVKYIYIQTTSENDYRSVGSFEIDGDSLIEIDWVNGDLCGADYFNPMDFVMVTKVDFLGTYSAITSYYVGANGTPIAANYEKTLVTRYDDYVRTMTSSRDLNATVIEDADGNYAYDDVIVPSGSIFYPISTDAESYMNFRLEDGRKVTIYVQRDDDHWEKMIDGMSEYDCFEDIMYAG